MTLDGFDLLTVKEIADILHCSKAHVCNLMAGRVDDCEPMPSISLGRRKLVRRATLATWIEVNEHPPANDTARVPGNDNLKPSPERGRRSV